MHIKKLFVETANFCLVTPLKFNSSAPEKLPGPNRKTKNSSNFLSHHLGDSKNSGTPKSSILKWFSLIKPSILGVPPYQETPIFQELLLALLRGDVNTYRVNKLNQPAGPGAPKRARMVATILSFPTWRKTQPARDVDEKHPGRLRAGSPTNHPFRKENDLN